MNGPQLRILLFIKSLSQGGAERQCCVLARQLAEAGHSVCVVVYDMADSFYAGLMPKEIPVVSLKRSRWNVPGLLFGLRRQIKVFKPDIVYSFMSHSNLLSVAIRGFSNTKTVCGIRSSALDLSSESTLSRFGEYLHRKALYLADLVIANSHAAKLEIIETGFLNEKIIVLANGIDTDRFHFNAVTRTEIRRELGYSDNDRVIGLFARLHPMKGHTVLLKAFSEAISKDRNLKLLLIGSGDSKASIVTLISENGLNGNVLILDQCPDIEHYYSAIDMYCSSSLYGEGFPNALSEAMSTGLPCIATDVGDSALIVAGFGQLIVAGDVQQLSDAICSCSAERIETNAEARRQHIVRNFGLRQFGERTIIALRHTLEN